MREKRTIVFGTATMFALLITVFILGAVTMNFTQKRASADSAQNVTYEIYPTPHSITYGSGTVTFTDKVRISFGSAIEKDGAAVDHAYSALSVADVLAYRGSEPEEGCTKVLIGTYGSGDEADTYIKNSTVKVDPNMFEKNDAYLLHIGLNTVIVLGKDADAAFYGITTLECILGQSGRTVRRLTVRDYSDSVFRGFIEGYYGIPWTTDERVELMEFGSKFKTNMYIYAPKDDAYHSSNWRGLYSDADLVELKEQIDAGTRTKTRFVWAIHPFMHDKFTASNYDKDLATVINKFEQLYAAGVRQFCISADDVDAGSDGAAKLDASLHRRLLNDVTAWMRTKGDCYDLIFVPSAYCYLSDTRLRVKLDYYYRTLMPGLDESVYIMWTGNDVCSSVSTGRFAEFEALSGRKAFMWLNWPVNDYAQSRLLMGKAEVLDAALPESGEPDFYGIVTNPMQHAEASKLSVFAIADYCWNINGFDADASYAASFKHVEPVATEAFARLCKHLANATAYEGRWFEESKELKVYIDAFEAAFNGGEPFAASATELKVELGRIISAADALEKTGANRALVKSFMPWASALSKLAESCSEYLDVLVMCSTADVSGGSLSESIENELVRAIEHADEVFASMKDCTSPVLDTVTYNRDPEPVEVAPAVLMPFARRLAAAAADEAALKLGRNTGVVYGGFDGVYQGDPSLAFDGDDNTFVWFEGRPSDGAYVRIDLGAITEIGDVRVLTGKPDGGDFMTGDIEYSTDGKNFVKLGEMRSPETIVDVGSAKVTARFIRLKDGGTPTWVAVREVAINTLEALSCGVTFGNIELEPSVVTNKYNMIDGDENTYTWFSYNNRAGAYIELDLLSVKPVSELGLLMAKDDSPYDYFPEVEISYSTDRVNYTTVGTYDGKEISVLLETPISARYIRATATQTSATGIVIREFFAK